MAWKKKEEGLPPLPEITQIKQAVAQPTQRAVPQQSAEPRGWIVNDYPASPARTTIRNNETGEEIDLMEAIAELLNRTEE